jgi:catechol 2,3-dioxygenase-like lactoylglutathione lyase family enzyme
VDDLENLRKRAKHLVRQHRDGVYVVAPRLRAALPRLAELTDRDVLAADFALHDAQQVIATELGFGSWAELKEAPPMDTPTADNLRFERATACIFVTEFDRALAFYRDVLGFEVEYTYGEPAFWGEIVRDGARLNLRHVDTSPWKAGMREAEQLLSAYVLTTDAKALFVEYQALDVDFHERLQRKPWGNNEFVVRDPDGNLILFGGPS